MSRTDNHRSTSPSPSPRSADQRDSHTAPESSGQHLSGHTAVQKIQQIAGQVRTCMFGTRGETGLGVEFRPMSIQAVEEDGSFWFLASTDSEHVRDIRESPEVALTVQCESASAYLSLSGKATVHQDRATIDKHWTPIAHNWFDGKDDPRLAVIEVQPYQGHYWETESGKIVTMAKMVLGAVTAGAIKGEGGVAGSLSVAQR